VRDTLRSMITLNKELNLDNDNLMECIHTLEEDLEFTVSEFRSLLNSVKHDEGLFNSE
jgi:hypothetical protein